MFAYQVSPPKGGTSTAYSMLTLGGRAKKAESVCQVPPNTIGRRSPASLTFNHALNGVVPLNTIREGINAVFSEVPDEGFLLSKTGVLVTQE